MANDIMLPNKKPQMPKAMVQEALNLNWPKDLNQSAYPIKLVGMRGYYEDTLGEPGQNDRGIFDDAIFAIGPDLFLNVNANTDPSKFRDSIATLIPGTYLYKIGMHNMKRPYKAFRQFGRVTVTRDGKKGTFTDTAAEPFYIDVHKGGYGTTSSEGCQTIYPDQYWDFINRVELEMHKVGQLVIPYTLIDVTKKVA